MRVFVDTEFIEDGRTIDLLSIGLVREDDRHFYAEVAEADHSRASDWVRENVLSHLQGGLTVWKRADLVEAIVSFVGPQPEFWGYYADYDWVVLCQLYGTMMDLPDGWPMYCRDLRQHLDERGYEAVMQPDDMPHHALSDAHWIADTFRRYA